MIENLSYDLIELIFDTLPVEISFIDADDVVRYYSKDGNRIFMRTPAVIGRKVQDCHPKKSLEKVEEILDGFKSGTLDKAEFWINLHDKKILIRYYPIRDKDGNYLGCIEVTQDITKIQKLQGEKRLL